VLVAALAALALGVTAPPAAAKTSCGRQIIEDWVADNRIDSPYPLHCYREAIAAVPEDLSVYTGIVEDIMSARNQAARNRTLQSTNPPPPSSASKAGKPDRALFARGFDKLGARNVDTVPLPLLILAGLSLLLIAAGAAGLVARRLRSGRGHTPPAA
jgi:hypothetical protein